MGTHDLGKSETIAGLETRKFEIRQLTSPPGSTGSIDSIEYAQEAWVARAASGVQRMLTFERSAKAQGASDETIVPNRTSVLGGIVMRRITRLRTPSAAANPAHADSVARGLGLDSKDGWLVVNSVEVTAVRVEGMERR